MAPDSLTNPSYSIKTELDASGPDPHTANHTFDDDLAATLGLQRAAMGASCVTHCRFLTVMKVTVDM